MEKDRLSFSGALRYPELSFSMVLGIVGSAVACPEGRWAERSVCVQSDASRGWYIFFLELLETQRALRGCDEGFRCCVFQVQFLGHRDFHGPCTIPKPGGGFQQKSWQVLVLCPQVYNRYQMKIQFSRGYLPGGGGFHRH